MYDQIWALWDEGLKPVTIAAILDVPLLEVYSVLDDGEYDDRFDVYDEDVL